MTVTPPRHVLGDLVLEDLHPLQRILLVADGTLTTLLELMVAEPMRVIKLAEEVRPVPEAVPALELEPGQRGISRRILLQGARRGINWLYAESLIVHDRLEPEFQQQLLHSQVPIGKLWIEHKTETYKEILTARRESAGDLARHFGVAAESDLLSRTYRVFCNRVPVMLITEKFPSHYFTHAPGEVEREA